jgi:hypothetical protein
MFLFVILILIAFDPFKHTTFYDTENTAKIGRVNGQNYKKDG